VPCPILFSPPLGSGRVTIWDFITVPPPLSPSSLMNKNCWLTLSSLVIVDIVRRQLLLSPPLLQQHRKRKRPIGDFFFTAGNGTERPRSSFPLPFLTSASLRRRFSFLPIQTRCARSFFFLRLRDNRQVLSAFSVERNSLSSLLSLFPGVLHRKRVNRFFLPS